MDNKKNIGSPDRDRINVNEAYELQYWSPKFGVSPDKLKKAVKDSGSTCADIIEDFLKK